MLQASPHAYHFKRIFSFGEGQGKRQADQQRAGQEIEAKDKVAKYRTTSCADRFSISCHTNRQSCDGLTSGGKNRIAHRRRDWRDAGLARTAYDRAAVDDRHRDFRRFAQCEQTVGIKIVLLRPAVLNSNLAEKRRGEPEDDAAFHLSPDAVRIKRHTTVDSTSDAMDGGHAFLDRNLD